MEWICPKCGRIFSRRSQPHSCKIIPIEEHFKNKKIAKELFDILLQRINKKIGDSKIISLPCCIHLYAKYDYLAVLPKKSKLEIRFGSSKPINNSRVINCIQTSTKLYKICINVETKDNIDNELIELINTAYHLKD